MPKIVLEGNRLILTKDYSLIDIPLLKSTLNKYNKQIHSVYSEGDISISSIYILKKYLVHRKVEVPKKYQEEWDLLDIKLPNLKTGQVQSSWFSAFGKTAGIFNMTTNDRQQNRFWIETFLNSFIRLAVDNASIVFLLFTGIGITLTYLSYDSLFEYGIELESIKVAMLFGLKVFCPMMSVILVTAKSCTAQASIIKSMWMNGDFKVMHIMNLPYQRVYLHPMFVACALTGPLVNLVAILGTLAGACLSWVAKGHPIELFFSILNPSFYMKYIFNSELRAFLASIFAGLCMCVAGLIPGRDFQSLTSVINTCIILSFLSNVLAQAIVSLFG